MIKSVGVKACNKCTYANTPDYLDKCNYCGILFIESDNTHPSQNLVESSGIELANLDLANIPDYFKVSTDSTDFLTLLQQEGRQVIVYRVASNNDSFFIILTGCVYGAIDKFLESHKELRIFNIYSDSKFGEDNKKNPIGSFGIGFEKRI